MADTTWFQDAKFGLFVHFGLYSIPAGVWQGRPMGRNRYAEWILSQWGWPKPAGIPRCEYDKLLTQFTADRFDADLLCREAASAGMRYFVFTTKHHDGFALWPTSVSSYSVAKTPCGRDIVGEMAAAGRKHGLKVGFYYSHWQDWEFPGGGLPPWPELPGDPPIPQPKDEAFEAYWLEKCLPQVAELIDRYAPDLFWFDSWGQNRSHQLTSGRLQRLIQLIRQKGPGILINSRIGTDKNVDYYSADDNQFAISRQLRLSETSATMNHSWGYSKLDRDFHSTRQILRSLLSNVAMGSNVQLNVGPRGDGSLEPAVLRRLRDLSAWMSVNGQALHSSRPITEEPPSWGHMVRKGDLLYAYVFDWPENRRLLLPAISYRVTNGSVLETDAGVEIEERDGQHLLWLPHDEPDDRASVIVLSLQQ